MVRDAPDAISSTVTSWLIFVCVILLPRPLPISASLFDVWAMSWVTKPKRAALLAYVGSNALRKNVPAWVKRRMEKVRSRPNVVASSIRRDFSPLDKGERPPGAGVGVVCAVTTPPRLPLYKGRKYTIPIALTPATSAIQDARVYV